MSERTVAADLLESIEVCRREGRHHEREFLERIAVEMGHLKTALALCAGEIEENLKFEGRLTSFKVALKLANEALGRTASLGGNAYEAEDAKYNRGPH